MSAVPQNLKADYYFADITQSAFGRKDIVMADRDAGIMACGG